MIAKTTTGSLLTAAICVLLTGAAAAQGTWTSKAPHQLVRSEVGVVAIGGKIYEVGGSVIETDPAKIKPDVFPGIYDSALLQEYDPATDKWRDLAPMPKGASHVAATVLNGKIYVAGGFAVAPVRGPLGGHRGAVDRFYVYDPATNNWQALAPLSKPLGAVGLAALDGKIHVVGGRGLDQVAVGTHEIYDPATGKWTPAAPLPTPRDHLGIVPLDGKLHVVGGRTTVDDNLALHDIFDPKTGKWTQAPPMPTARSGVAFAAYRGLVVIAGGECKDAKSPTPFGEKKTYAENEAFDPKTGKWTTLAPFPGEGLHAFGGAVSGDSIYFMGGAHGCGGWRPSKDVLAFKLP